MRRGEVIGELRLLGATEVHMPQVLDPVNPCHALYSLPLHPKTYRRMTESMDDAKGTTETVGSLMDSCMRFTLTGERVDSPTMPVKGRVNALLPNISAGVRRSTGTARPCWRLLDNQSRWEC